MAISQARLCIAELHAAAIATGVAKMPLEVSTKSANLIGASLSAFRLTFRAAMSSEHAVENWFQSSKVFEGGGPFTDLLYCAPKDAKRDPRLASSGRLVRFHFEDRDWPLVPRTAFYDWLYTSALSQHADLAQAASEYDAFTDIAFNPEKSLNCQARSIALFLALQRAGALTDALSSPTRFVEVCRQPSTLGEDGRLFDL